MIEKITWLTTDTVKQLAYQYWNDEEIEKKKPYYSASTECEKLYSYVQKLGVYDDLKSLLKKVLHNNCKVISLASGVYWEAKLLIEYGIKEMDFLDFSEHRIMKMAPYAR